MTPRKAGSNAYHLGLFAAISVLCGLFVAGLILPFAAISGYAVKAGANSLESLPAELAIGPQQERSQVLMADGKVLADFADENRVYVSLDKIAPIMRQAQVAIEDSSFYQHGAISFRGTARAALRSASGNTQGGSTLTQQYVKQVQIEAAAGDPAAQAAAREQSLTRKVRELRYAVAVEKKLSKDQILERYLNIAYYGSGAYGVEAAARHYFGATAATLTLPQAAMLAGLVQNPNNTDPINHPVSAINRRNVVLNRMAQLNIITPAQVTAAKKVTFDKSKVTHPKLGCLSSPFPSLCAYVQNSLTSDDFPSLGRTPAERMATLKRGGLTIQTLIDPKAQRSAQDAVSGLIAPTDPFISTSVLIQPKSGLIVAMAQNRPQIGDKPGQSWYNYAVDAKHGGAEGYQAGSTFKAFTMAAAFATGVSPNRTIYSPPTRDFTGDTFRSCKGPFVQTNPFPVKNSTSLSGTINMVEAAKMSVNTYFVGLEQQVGVCNAVKMAMAAGAKLANGQDMIADAHLDQIPSFTLGPVEVTPLSMAEAYATFANRGVHCNPIIVKSITAQTGKQLAVPDGKCTKVMEPRVADQVAHVLSKVIGPGGTANPAYLDDGRDQAAKTGTTNNGEAVWLAGFTPDMAGIAMIAADKQSPEYKGKTKRSIQYYRAHGYNCPSSGCELAGSGGHDAGKIWHAAMTSALADIPPSDFHDPSEDSSSSDKTASIPANITSMGPTDAQAALESAGFTDVNIDYQHSSTTPSGALISVSPDSGTWPTTKEISIVVSSGPKPAATGSTQPASPPASPKPTATKSR